VIPVLDGYQLVTPGSLGAALDDLAAHPGARPFAGGTDLMVVLEAGHLPPGRYVNLAACAELRGIARTPDGGLSIGATTRQAFIDVEGWRPVVGQCSSR